MAANGGFYNYNDRVTQDVHFRKSAKRVTRAGTIKSGQVLKKYTFLQSDAAGKLIAHTGLSEVALVKFATITTGQTLILGGLTFTAGSGSVTAAELVEIWRDLPAGIGYAAAATELLARGVDAAVAGTFTAGTFGAWNTSDHNAVDKVLFVSTTALTNVTDLADTGTATDPTITVVAGATSFPEIAGMTMYDVNAASADVDAEVFAEVSLWADVINWYVDSTADTITNHDGTTTACSAYNTATTGDTKAATELLQAKFVAGSKFSEIGFLSLGEVANG